jgi:hypothetical protein
LKSETPARPSKKEIEKMKLLSKGAILTATGAVLLGTSVALSNVGAVFGASQAHGGSGQIVPAKRSCNTSNYCLTESNSGSGGGLDATNNSSTDATIDATNGNSTAIYARSQDGAAVIGLGTSEAGVVAQSNGTDADQAALEAQGSTTGTNLLLATNSATNNDCYIDAYADLNCTGTIQGTLEGVHRNSAGQRVITYAAESATATVEDVGTARMSGGVANVQIDPSFAAVMDRKWYYVFLTPLGDTRGLYVSIKTATAFQVRETERGRDSLEFDYRIVAHPLDGKNERLAAARAMPRP